MRESDNIVSGLPVQGALSRECVTEGLWTGLRSDPADNPSVIRLA